MTKDMEGQDEGGGDKCVKVPGDGGEENFGGEFADDLFQPSVERRNLSWAQKRVERHAHRPQRVKHRPDGRPRQLEEGLEISAEKLQRL